MTKTKLHASVNDMNGYIYLVTRKVYSPIQQQYLLKMGKQNLFLKKGIYKDIRPEFKELYWNFYRTC